jgi:hypothetical protein
MQQRARRQQRHAAALANAASAMATISNAGGGRS